MKLSEIPSADSYKVGEGEWKPTSTLPDVWKVVHQCREAGLDIHEAAPLAHWLIFLSQHKVATMEEFLQKFAECAEKKDFYEFSKYCLALYRKVHEKQIRSSLNRIEKPLIEQFMQEAEEMEELGNEYHQNPKDSYWQKSASIAAPDDRELPRQYIKQLESYGSFEKFMEAHKECDEVSKQPAPRITSTRKATAHTIHGTLDQ